MCKTLGVGAFAHVGLSLWNTLPVPTRSIYCFVIKKKILDVQALSVQIDFSDILVAESNLWYM